MTPQKRRRVREKDRLRKRTKKELEKARLEQCNRKSKPKRTSVNNTLESVIRPIVQNLHKDEKEKVARAAVKSKLGSARTVSRVFGISRRLLSRKKSRDDEVQLRKLEKVKAFYIRSDVSRVIPKKRYGKKSGPCYVLQMTLKAAYALFSHIQSPVVSFSTFCKLRPKQVLLQKHNIREYCLCPYCQNIKYKLMALKHARALPDNITSEKSLVEAILCPKGDNEYCGAECIRRECNQCSDWDQKVEEICAVETQDATLTWNHWEREKDASGKKKTVLKIKTSTKDDLVKEFASDFSKPTREYSFVNHTFVALWQYHRFCDLKKTLSPGSVIMIMDFAANYNTHYQDEVKAAAYSYNQITIHPIVMYYHPISQDREATLDEPDLTRHVVTIIS